MSRVTELRLYYVPTIIRENSQFIPDVNGVYDSESAGQFDESLRSAVGTVSVLAPIFIGFQSTESLHELPREATMARGRGP